MSSASTIFAPATAPGRAGVAVIRVSGPEAARVFEVFHVKRPRPRTAGRAYFQDPVTGAPLDDGLVLWFPGPKSFTGEDVVELHTHGGRAVTDAVLGVLDAQPGYRWARPGEFSRRAFEAGKLDLTQVEAISDLVDAETDAQRVQALGQLGGALSALYHGWRNRLLRAVAHLEAVIDFPDEDLPEETARGVWQDIAALKAEIEAHLADHRRGEIVRDGLSVAIIGAPNAGKSSLLNALAAREAAIVSDIAGTTRDIVDVHLNIAGYQVILSDTAGLRAATDEIEDQGIQRALARAEAADLVIALYDGTVWPDKDPTTAARDRDALIVVNKLDLMRSAPEDGLAVSAKTGAGISALLDVLAARLKDIVGAKTAAPPTRARHASALRECVSALARAPNAPEAALAGEDLRLALRALGRITGEVDVEELLDVIFRDFCIGK